MSFPGFRTYRNALWGLLRRVSCVCNVILCRVLFNRTAFVLPRCLASIMCIGVRRGGMGGLAPPPPPPPPDNLRGGGQHTLVSFYKMAEFVVQPMRNGACKTQTATTSTRPPVRFSIYGLLLKL